MPTEVAQGEFGVSSWSEKSYLEDGGQKLTEADVTQAFSGAIEGDGSVKWLMCYRPDGTADWVGLQRIVGQLAGRTGSFVLRSEGTFDGAKAVGTWHVVPGSGTGELQNLVGEGRMEAPFGSSATYELHYEL